MMRISLTEEEKHYLKQFARVSEEEQEEHGTIHPIIVVEDQRRQIVRPEADWDFREFSLTINNTHDRYFRSIDTLTDYLRKELVDFFKYDPEYIEEEIIDEIELHFETLLRDDEWSLETEFANIYVSVNHYQNYYLPVAYFFTKAEAKKYIQEQDYNLSNPRVVARAHGYKNNGDFAPLRSLLLRMGALLNDAED